MSNSNLVCYTNISPNKTAGRKHAIDTITPHCFVGQVDVKRGCDIFKPTSKQASCNYVVAKDGKIGLVVEEKDRSWCSSSSSNDNRAITVEIASDTKAPYAITSAALNGFIALCVDVMKRNGLNKLIYIPDKNQALIYTRKKGECLITFHRWFKNKACPGEYIISKIPYICAEVNKQLNGTSPIIDTADSEIILYTTQKGDTLSQIARKYNTTIQAIQKLNPNTIKDVNKIGIGWKLRIK